MGDLFAMESTGAIPSPVVRVTRTLSLTQPWATLVAIGAKKWETRSWRTPYTGWLAIHASKGFPNDCKDLCYMQPYYGALKAAGYAKREQLYLDLPRGQVIAVVFMVGCRSTNNWTPPVDGDEFAFGDYSEDRYAWQLDQVRRIKPFDAKGALGVWQLPRPITAEDLL